MLQARSDAAYLLFHRGLTHSLIGLVVLPLVLAAGLWWGYGGRTRFGWMVLVCGCGVGLHLVYDLTTSWGTMLLYPLSPRRYALDWLFIVDLVTWAVPIVVLVVSRARPARAREAVVVGMVALLAYGTAAGVLHRSAIDAIVGAEAPRAVGEAVVFPYAATIDQLSGDPTYHNPTLLASPGAIYSKKGQTIDLQKLSPKLTACNPVELEGCVFFTTSIEKDGAVSGVDPFVSDGLPRHVDECLAGVLKEARFEAGPKAGKMQVPVTFTRSR